MAESRDLRLLRNQFISLGVLLGFLIRPIATNRVQTVPDTHT